MGFELDQIEADRGSVPPHVRPPTSRLAIASLVFAFLCPLVGFFLGLIAIVRIKLSRDALAGLPLAIVAMVVSGLACAAAVLLPGLLRSRIPLGESPSISGLKAICTGQEQFKNSQVVDQNGNGVGEYGFLSELGGITPCRASGEFFPEKPFIPSVLGKVDAGGVSIKAGYCFKVYLPGPRGDFLGETGITTKTVDAETARRQEEFYVAYAWPQVLGKTGSRIFCIDPLGQPYGMPCPPQYSGAGNPPPWDLAFADPDGDGVRRFEDGIDTERWAPAG